MAATMDPESSVQPSILQPEFEASAAPAAPPKTLQKYSDANRGSIALQTTEMQGCVVLDISGLLSVSLLPEMSSAARRVMAAEGAFQCRTCGRRFPSLWALGEHRRRHTLQQTLQGYAHLGVGGHHRMQARMLSDDPAGIRARSFHESGNYTTNAVGGGEQAFTTGGDTGGTRGTTDQGGDTGVPSSRDQVSIISVADLEALLWDTTRTADNNNGDDEGATVNAKKSIEQADLVDLLGGKEDPVDYTSPMVGVFAAAIALRASSMASYPVLEKALGDLKLARLAYDFPWVLIFILGVGLLVNVAFDRSSRARIFGKYALLMAIATILCVATWCWSSLQISAA